MAIKFEIVFPCDKPILMADGSSKLWSFETIKSVVESHNCRWVIARHPIDTGVGVGTCNFTHWHCGISTTSDNTYDTIAKWFGLNANSVNKVSGKFDSTYLLYLKHYNAKYDDGSDKPIIDVCDIVSNFKLDYDKLIGNIETRSASDDILLKISNGDIKRYEFKDKLSDAFRIKYSKQINTALDIWNDKKMRGSIAMNKTVIWIYGVAGVGKTELAKYFARAKNLAYYMSDSGSNPFDNYADEPCIILDDVGSDNLNGKVVLKLFDPHNKCFTKARYYNKPIDAELIIVTSSISPQQFWSACRDNYGSDGGWEQLLRRLNGGVYNFSSKSSMSLTMYDNDGSNPFTCSIAVPQDVQKHTVSISAETRVNDMIAKFGLVIDSDGSVSGHVDGFEQLAFNTDNPFDARAKNDNSRPHN